ncbi:alpha/beta hydrolase [Aquibacillus kalidii]|uniref:alpha/beta hydrolase n=1 Tax=Aquibacillus kalidii TaxID=2762597 RepID=UPI0016471C41|nr:alpha/beta hydrolase [Aquibacillus kalidii]
MYISLYEPSKQLESVNENIPSLTPYLLDGESPSPIVIVCPGGAYMNRADHEGEPVAKWLNEIGISAVVLHYRVYPHQYPAALHDALRAIRLVRHHATEWNIDPDRVGILGFSAGGHLAATASIHNSAEAFEIKDSIDQCSSKPDLTILCYPVITMGLFTHKGSKQALLGEDPDESLVEHLSMEKQVIPNTPPTFIWHTADDEAVPVENSLQFASSLSINRVPYACHLFENGRHGLGLAEDNMEVKQWTELCEQWLRKKGF